MPALWTVNLFVNRKTDRKIKTPNYCKVLYKKDFSTASNFYTKIFQIQKKSKGALGVEKKSKFACTAAFRVLRNGWLGHRLAKHKTQTGNFLCKIVRGKIIADNRLCKDVYIGAAYYIQNLTSYGG